MISPRKGMGQQSVGVTSSIDKHKLWLIIGIVLAVVLVLIIVLYSSFSETIAGRAAGLATSVGTVPGGVSSTAFPGGAYSIPVVTCMDIQAVPAIVKNKAGTLTLRQNICESAGCTYDTLGTTNITDDQCLGIRTACPRITLDTRTTAAANTGRRNVCESATCYFSEGPATGISYVGVDSDDCSPYYVDGRTYTLSSGVSCIGAWSYLPFEDQSQPPPADSEGRRRIECCSSSTNCVNINGDCIGFDQPAGDSGSICGLDSNLDRCGSTIGVNNVNKLPRDFSYGGNMVCLLDDESSWYLWLPVPEEICFDSVDNDFDDLNGCADPDCYGQLGPTPGTICPVLEPENCPDGIDNDGDGLADCQDPDCDQLTGLFGTDGLPLFCEYDVETRCTDGFDNDADGMVDCDDTDCRGNSACPEAICDDSIDNDGDGGTLRAYYPFDGQVEDVSGNNYDGSISATANVISCDASGIMGQSCHFDPAAIYNYISLPAEVMNGLNDFYLDFWLRSDYNNDAILSAAYGNDAEANEFLLMHSLSGNRRLHLRIKNKVYNFTNALFDISDNTWHHVIVSRDGDSGRIRMHVDNVERIVIEPAVLPTGPLTVAGGGLIIGQDQDSLGGGFESSQSYRGQLDELRIYDYEWGRGLDCLDSDCQTAAVDSCTFAGVIYTETGLTTGMFTSTEVDCADVVDNDRDGDMDCDDSDCASGAACLVELCTNGIDDNANGFVDCADPGCSSDIACPTCMNITLLPGGTGSAADPRENARKEVCESVGCSLVNDDGDTSNDECRGTRIGCPAVAEYSFTGLLFNNGRRDLCVSVDCRFTDLGGTAGSGDRCEAIEREAIAVFGGDADGDGIVDSWEDARCAGDCDPTADADGDGATTLEEYTAGSDPDNADTDGDGVGDNDEAVGCALLTDCDSDGVPDNADGCANTLSGALVDAQGCSEDQRASVCSGSNPSACTTLDACIAAGNFWQNTFTGRQCYDSCQPGTEIPASGSRFCLISAGGSCTAPTQCSSGLCDGGVCLADADRDGVPDTSDLCPATSASTTNGCPPTIDIDDDDIDDNGELLICQNTPPGYAVLTLGEYAGCLRGDIDVDGDIDSNDIATFISVYNHREGGFAIPADLDENNVLDSDDIAQFIFAYNHRP